MPGAVAHPASAQSARAVPLQPFPPQHPVAPGGARLPRRSLRCPGSSCSLCGFTPRSSTRRRRPSLLAAIVIAALLWPALQAIRLAGADVASWISDRAEVRP